MGTLLWIWLKSFVEKTGQITHSYSEDLQKTQLQWGLTVWYLDIGCGTPFTPQTVIRFAANLHHGASRVRAEDVE